MNAVILSVILCVFLAGSAYCQQRGTQLRLTQKGLDYSKYENFFICTLPTAAESQHVFGLKNSIKPPEHPNKVWKPL